MASVPPSPAGVVTVVGVLLALAGTDAHAASEVDVGGFHDQAIATTRHDLLGEGAAPGAVDAGGRMQLRLDTGPGSALTAFTPRLGGLAIAGRRHSEANLQVDEPEARRLQLELNNTAEVAGWEIGLAATADVAHTPPAGDRDASSELVVGGQLAVLGVRFDAAVGRDSTLLGEQGDRVTAGIGYEFGPLDTRMSYSLVESEARATETGLLTLGSSLALSSSLKLQGDLAIADEQDGDGTTAGRVSLRWNF